MAPTVETVDPDTETCALNDCAEFMAGHCRREGCWLCWLARRPHGWHPGDPLGARVSASKLLVNSEEDPLVAAPVVAMPLFGQAFTESKEDLASPAQEVADETSSAALTESDIDWGN